MTDAPALLPKTTLSDPPVSDGLDAPPSGGGRGLLPVLCAIGFLVLAAAIFYVWDNPQEPAEAPELHSLSGRVAALEQRTPPDIDALESRISALEKRPLVPPGAADAASKTEVTQLASRIDAVGARADQLSAQMQSADRTQAQRLDGLDGRLAGEVKAAEQAQTQRLDTLDGKVSELAKQQAGDAALADKLAALEPRLAALDQRIAALEKAAGGMSAMESRQARLARVQAAAAALEAGAPLGPLPGAPPALARYATERPPTLAALKLAFPAAMRAAEEASIPSPAQADIWNRMWDRVQGLVVVRQGDSVVVGNPAAGVLARAERLLDAGDLAGAVQAVETLGGSAAAAMASWLGQARDLLAAREAMTALAAHA